MAVITDAEALRQAINYEEDLPYTWVKIYGAEIAFAIPNEKNVYFVDSLKDREPATNDWIKGFEPGHTFFDIGANIGVFSLLAAKVAGCRVVAFEPHYGSYYFLMRNIILNGVNDRVSAYPLAISDKAAIDALYVSDLTAGKSLNNFGAARPSGEAIENAVVPLPAVSETLDGFVERTGIVPTHLKIDVDGLEDAVLRSGTQTLGQSGLKAVCVEINDQASETNEVFSLLEGNGFTLENRAGENAYFKR